MIRISLAGYEPSKYSELLEIGDVRDGHLVVDNERVVELRVNSGGGEYNLPPSVYMLASKKGYGRLYKLVVTYDRVTGAVDMCVAAPVPP